MRFLQIQGDQIIEQLNLNANDKVLDIAAGTGEPGLTIASVVYEGLVTAVDLSEGMLQIAREKAEAKGIINFHTQVADVCELPFEDGAFDAVSCRLGFMFFPDMKLAAKEMLRVLKPGGKLAVTVWGEPNKNLWITALMGAIKRNVQIPDPPLKDAPGMFRCAHPGFMNSLFEDVGLAFGEEVEIEGTISCSSDEYWEFMNDVVPPVVSVFNNIDQTVQNKIKKEVYDLLDQKIPRIQKDISFGARLFKAEKSR
jgi:SAM-dependent methyltransferase